jgi:hypothetical protein
MAARRSASERCKYHQIDKVHAPCHPSQGEWVSCTFYINIDSGHSALERLPEMRSSVCRGRYGPEWRVCAGDGWLDRGSRAPAHG